MASSTPLADICEDGFVQAFNKAYKVLRDAKQTYDNPRRALNLGNLHPNQVAKASAVFWKRLDKVTAGNLRNVYDISVASSSGIGGVLYSITFDYQTCIRLPDDGTYHICNFTTSRSGLVTIATQEDWNKLLQFTQSLIHSNAFHGEKLHKCKRTKESIFQGSSASVHNFLTKSMYENDQAVLGNLAACVMWMADTKGMNKSYETQNSNAGSTAYNTRTILRRNYVPPPPVKIPEPAAETPKPEEEQQEEQQEDEIVDNWEQLLDD